MEISLWSYPLLEKQIAWQTKHENNCSSYSSSSAAAPFPGSVWNVWINKVEKDLGGKKSEVNKSLEIWQDTNT